MRSNLRTILPLMAAVALGGPLAAQTPSASPSGALRPAPPAQSAPPLPGTTPSAVPSPCSSEANSQNLTGPARTSFMVDCHRRRGDPASGAGSGGVLSTQRLPTTPRVGRSRQECREAARNRRLWGLARHRFLQRCRYGTNRRTPPPLNR